MHAFHIFHGHTWWTFAFYTLLGSFSLRSKTVIKTKQLLQLGSKHIEEKLNVLNLIHVFLNIFKKNYLVTMIRIEAQIR